MIAISESKSYPVSAYLSPRAYHILSSFHEGSLYGSLSRTIEEIILAFSDVYIIARAVQRAEQEGRRLAPDAKDYVLGQIKTIATGRLSMKEPSGKAKVDKES